MTIATLEYIHNLLRNDVQEKETLLDKNRAFCNKLHELYEADYVDGTLTEEQKDTMQRACSDRDVSKDAFCAARDALEDFENQDF